MRRGTLLTIVLLVAVVLLGTQISELFDTWDNTLQTGNDIEFNLTIVALCIGACVLFAKLILRLFRNLVRESHPFLLHRLPQSSRSTRELCCFLLAPSPPPLRV